MGFDYDIQDNNEGRGMINMTYGKVINNVGVWLWYMRATRQVIRLGFD